jgi:hypothetical protein
MRQLAVIVVAACAAFASAQPCDPYWDVDIGNPGTSGNVQDFMERDLGAGPRVLVCGLFFEPFDAFAVWDGQGWSPLGDPIDGGDGNDFEVFDDGSGEKLYVCGNIYVGGDKLWHVARLDSDSWTFLDHGDVTNSVNEMIVWDDGTGPALYVTGDFDTLDGVTAHNSIAKWDGQRWHALNSGINGGFFRIGRALEVFDDGSGEKLYMGGAFERVDGEVIKNLARWDGSEWTAIGTLDHGVKDLCVHDDGSGRALYAVGDFESIDGRSMKHVARWDGIDWSGLDGGTEGGGGVNSCVAYDDGSGPQLYVSGHIRSASGKPMCNIARWDGTEWHDVAGGFECGTAAGAFGFLPAPPNSPFGPSLFAGGAFRQAGGQSTNYIAEYRPCHCPADFNNDGAVDTRDVLAFLNAWASDDPSADFNNDGAIDTRDVLAFLNAWAAGC